MMRMPCLGIIVGGNQCSHADGIIGIQTTREFERRRTVLTRQIASMRAQHGHLLARRISARERGVAEATPELLATARWNEELAGRLLDTASRELDAGALARQVLDLFQLQAQQRGLDLRLTAPDTPLTVWLDVGALSRILTNLISNAIKFTKDGHVSVILEDHGDTFEIRVEDTGADISEEFIPSLFSEFRQEAGTLAANAPGSGLGLAITKRLVALLGGSIDVESEKGRGSVFTVRLPRGKG